MGNIENKIHESIKEVLRKKRELARRAEEGQISNTTWFEAELVLEDWQNNLQDLRKELI